MAELNIKGTQLGNNLQDLLNAPDMQPGDTISYQTAKTIYSHHPLGAKLVDFPLTIAQSQPRVINVQKGPEEVLREAFEKEWLAIGADRHILNTARLARIYGVSSIALLTEGEEPDTAVDYTKLPTAQIGFNVLDPLNTAGSLVLNQDPNNIDFQKVPGISVQGKAYHRSRTTTLLNEDPIYIEYTSSAFGYVGRSIFQRALFPLKSFIATLTTDDMVAIKAGVLIAKLKQQSSAIDQLMANVAGQKRQMLKEATTGNVISIGSEDEVSSLDLKNLEAPYALARRNILENIASSAGTPAKLILAETFAEGFGEGSEDAKHVAQHIQRLREWLGPVYAYFDKIVRARAWGPEFYRTIQNQFPDEYGDVDYTTAFWEWSNSFTATWPSLLEEPESEKVKVDEVKLKAVIALLEVLLPALDPVNKAATIQWACDNFNDRKLLFSSPLVLDIQALEEYAPSVANEDGAGNSPVQTSFTDSSPVRRAVEDLSAAVARLPDRSARRRAVKA
jgi:hypothetical protein